MDETNERALASYAQIRLDKSMDPRAIRTRKAMEDALLALLEKRSFESITPRDITDAAGFAYGTFYRHHPSKEAMLEELARREVARLYDSAVDHMEIDGPHAATVLLCRRFQDRKELWSALLNGGARALIREELMHGSHLVALDRAYPGDVLPWELSSAIANAAVAEIIAWWLPRDDRYPVEFAADMIIRFVHEPIKAMSTSPNLRLRKETE